MPLSSPLFDINQLNTEQQRSFYAAYNELKSNHDSYIQYKLDLPLKTKFDRDEEENEWHYELYRFLRARKWNVQHTVKAMAEMMQWRKDNRIDSILEDESVISRLALLRTMIPGANHGYTKAHRPIYIEKSGLMPVDKVLNQFTSEELVQTHIYWLEFYCQRARERSRQLGIHVESFAMIYDLKRCKLEMRKSFPLFRESLQIDNNYYPERLGQMFIVNPPAVFPVLWNLVKHWLDPVTKSKVQVIKKGPGTATALLQHIDADQLPQEYGGSCKTCPTSPDCLPVGAENKNIVDDAEEEEEEEK